MMLARVADSLYWIGRYVERAEHVARLTDVMLNATLDRSEAARRIAWTALSALGETDEAMAEDPVGAAAALAVDRDHPGSIHNSISRARENARQVRDQISTETWERLNMIFLRLTGPRAAKTFETGSQAFLHEVIADLHLFRGAGDATLSHGEGWSFLSLGVYLERAQLIAALLAAAFGGEPGRPPLSEHFGLTNVLRMSCALEPYLRAYTADMQRRHILEFLVLDEDFPRSIRFCTRQIESHLGAIARHAGGAPTGNPDRLAGRLRARLQYADMTEIEGQGASPFLRSVLDDCAQIHRSLHDAYVTYPLEERLPA